jgi:hypothetical protein
VKISRFARNDNGILLFTIASKIDSTISGRTLSNLLPAPYPAFVIEATDNLGSNVPLFFTKTTQQAIYRILHHPGNPNKTGIDHKTALFNKY